MDTGHAQGSSGERDPAGRDALPAEPWPFPHAAVYDADAKRFRQCVKVSYAGRDVRLWPEEYEQVAMPPVISTIRFASFDDDEEI